jgi:hypothetical protein
MWCRRSRPHVIAATTPRAKAVRYRPPTETSDAPLQFLILLVASWLRRHQGEAIEYLRAENRVLRARLGHVTTGVS